VKLKVLLPAWLSIMAWRTASTRKSASESSGAPKPLSGMRNSSRGGSACVSVEDELFRAVSQWCKRKDLIVSFNNVRNRSPQNSHVGQQYEGARDKESDKLCIVRLRVVKGLFL
jgi:hypothetical protein